MGDPKNGIAKIQPRFTLSMAWKKPQIPLKNRESRDPGMGDQKNGIAKILPRFTFSTVDGINLATPRAPRGPKRDFEGSGGAWGHHQSTRDEKTCSGSYFREFWLGL